ncbi:MAG TPA: hypothetical protein VK506_09975 [Conexibacter sp.]|nr:hypothetical protein [Conexibacter sp.]
MPATATKPAPKAAKAKPEPQGVGIKELADHLGIDPRSLRGFLRRTQRSVGRGTRYEWPSLRDAAVKKIVADWRAAQAEADDAPERAA